MRLQSVRIVLGSLTIMLAMGHLTLAADSDFLPVISHEKLQDALKDSKVRILDARPKVDYDKGHVPGAVWVDTKGIQALAKAETIKDSAAWSKSLAPLGIHSGIKAVYVYDNDRQHDAARIWWSLSYAGLSNIGLVDGGFDVWVADKRSISTEAVVPETAVVKTEFHAEYLASRAEVAKGAEQLLDARAPEEYTGEKPGRTPTSPVGHIPGALNLNSYSLVDAGGRFLDKDKAALKTRFEKAGIDPTKPVIAYSAGGNRSSILLFALKEIGVSSRHYIGGTAEWTKEKGELIKGNNPK